MIEFEQKVWLGLAPLVLPLCHPCVEPNDMPEGKRCLVVPVYKLKQVLVSKSRVRSYK